MVVDDVVCLKRDCNNNNDDCCGRNTLCVDKEGKCANYKELEKIASQ